MQDRNPHDSPPEAAPEAAPDGPPDRPRSPARRPVLRPATPTDLPALAALERDGFREAWSEDSLADELEHPDALILVVEAPEPPPEPGPEPVPDEGAASLADAATPAGNASATPADGLATPRAAPALAAYGAWRRVVFATTEGPVPGGEAELLRLAVARRWRRRGLASALLAAADRELHAAGCAVCFLEVRADNAGAIAFYERLGFHSVGRRRGYYGGGCDALLYARRVRPGKAARRSRRG